jgi:ubiquinone/menaquinone biosynthesis C-methylase UbiE
MATKDGITQATDAQVKQCCATLYESDLARYLLGDSFHPGGSQTTRRLGDMLSLNFSSRVLDVACGKGTTAVFLAKEFGCEVIGVDYGGQNVEASRALVQAEQLEGRVQFERSDAESLPFRGESFDAIICECAFCTFPQKPLAAAEFFRVLRPGGRVGISDLTRAETLPADLGGLLAWIACIGDAQTVENYTACLRQAGFSVNQVEPHHAALQETVDQIRRKLLAAEIMTGLKKLHLPGVDLEAAKRMASSAAEAIQRGHLGYVLIGATKPSRQDESQLCF